MAKRGDYYGGSTIIGPGTVWDENGKSTEQRQCSARELEGDCTRAEAKPILRGYGFVMCRTGTSECRGKGKFFARDKAGKVVSGYSLKELISAAEYEHRKAFFARRTQTESVLGG